jgi:ankyrin repeat protein
VQALLNRGANVNATDHEGKTALMWAAQNGRQDVVPVLLEKGADVNAKDKKGKTALDLARNYQQEHTGALLLKAGANAGKGSESPAPGKPGEKLQAPPPSGKGQNQGR